MGLNVAVVDSKEGVPAVGTSDVEDIHALITQLEALRSHLCALINEKGSFLAEGEVLKISRDFDRLAGLVMRGARNHAVAAR